MLTFRFLIAAVLVGSASLALAQAWPQKPVRVVVPYAAGGNTDSQARIASERLTSVFGQPFLVENRVGGSGMVAAELVAKAAPDGYTLFFCAVPQISIVPHVQKLGFEPRKDLVPISVVGISANIIGVHRAVPARSLQEFVDYAKSRPGKLNYATGGAGTFGHLATALFLIRAGLEMTHVPYKGGAQATTDLVGGQVQMYFGNAAELIPQARTGKVLLLGVSSPQRNVQIPDVPALAETYPGFALVAWNGYMAPAGTPAEIVDRIAQEVGKAVRDPTIAERLTKLGIDPLGNTPAQFAEMIRSEETLYRDAVKAANLRAE